MAITKDSVGIVLTVKFWDDDGTARDISGADTISIVLTKPDGTKVEEVASFVTDGTDGEAQYTLKAGDVDQSGIYEKGARYQEGTADWYLAETEELLVVE